MAIDDIDTLSRELPEVFADIAMPAGWEDEWIFIPIEDPEQDSSSLEQQLNYEVGSGNDSAEMASQAPVPYLPSFGDSGLFPGRPIPRRRSGEPPPPDALAFYLPFHFFYPTWWGIYLTLEGTHELADILVGHSDGRLSPKDAFACAKLFLYGHEAFHHAVESFATRLEITHRRPLYRNPFQNLYSSTFDTDDCLEEALANAHGYRKVVVNGFRKPDRPEVRRVALEAIQKYINGLGPGYRRGMEFVRDTSYGQGRSAFAEDNHRAAFPTAPRKDSSLWLLSSHLFSGVSRVTSRVNFVVHRHAPISTRLGLHLRYLRYRDLAVRLEKIGGCKPVREGKGSHVIWASPAGNTSPVPRHPGDLARGTLAAIVKQAGLRMSLSEFIRGTSGK